MMLLLYETKAELRLSVITMISSKYMQLAYVTYTVEIDNNVITSCLLCVGDNNNYYCPMN